MAAKKTQESGKQEEKKKEGNERENWLKPPEKSCTDQKCPFHGNLRVHGRIFVGKVTKPVFHKTATIEFERQFYIQKYERYERRRTRVKAHVPPCIDVEKGMVIKIAETRPIAKTKNFVTIEVMNNESN
jgi:small subunit ribosomal protein S17